jgi:cytochrome c-type biogenesis protein
LEKKQEVKEYFISFFSGFFSFISPCVLPLLPGYLSLVSGICAKEILEGNFRKNMVLIYSTSFVLGFSLVFVILGAFSSVAGGFLAKNRIIFQQISGILVFIMGIHISGIIRVPFLNFEKRSIYKTPRVGFFESFLVGMSFAFGWSPCIGPFLASILTMAAHKTVLKAVLLLFIYSLGFGLPFLFAGVFAEKFFSFMNRNKRIFYYFEKIGGLCIAIIGVLIFFDRFSVE